MIDYISKNTKEIELAYRVAMELCNFKCPYCNGDGKRFLDKEYLLNYLKTYQENIHSNIKKIIDIVYDNYGYKIKLLLKGGEPCILPLEYWENFRNYLDYQKISKIIFYTNFSESLEYFIKINDLYGDKIIFDCAWHNVNPESIDQFINKVYEFKNKNANVKIHFTVDDDNFIGEEICERIKKLNIPLEFTKIIDKRNKFNNKELKNEYLLNYFNNNKKTEKKYIISENGIKSNISLQDIKDMSFKNQNLICLGKLCIKLIRFSIHVSSETSIFLSPFSSCDYKKFNNSNNIKNNVLNISDKKLDYQTLKDYLKKFEYKCEKKYKECSNINCSPTYIYNINYKDKINE